MRENHMRARHGYRTRGWSVGKPSAVVPNLLQRQFTVTRRSKVWVTDITYIRTWQGGLYVAVVMDCSLAGSSAGQRDRPFTSSSPSMPCSWLSDDGVRAAR